MRLRIQGTNPLLSKKEMREYVIWLGKELLGKMQVSVLINNKSLWEELSWGDCLEWGACYIRGEDRPPRAFEIDLDDSSTRRHLLMISIAHEMVHVEQWATEKMIGNDLVYWHKRARLVDQNKTEYDNRPWEKDAERRAGKLYRKYKQIQKEKANGA